MNMDPSRRTPGTSVERPRRRFKALFPIFIMAMFVLALAAQEVPAVRDMFQRWVDPAAWQAGQVCRQAALGLAAQPEYARIVAPGDVHATQNGFFVDKLSVGEMGQQGGEERFVVSCYIDQLGQVVRADRIER